MRIFIGGQKRIHIQAFEREFPDVTFTYATADDALHRWLSGAAGANYAIVDQSRCAHDITAALRKRGHTLYYCDGKLAIRQLIERLRNDGQQGRYVAAYSAG